MKITAMLELGLLFKTVSEVPPQNWTPKLTKLESNMTRKYTAFTKEFKLEALRLAEQPNTCIARLARDLGIRRNMIYKWREQLKTKQDKAFKRTATNDLTDHHKATHAELLKKNKQLEKELELSRMEVDILKKAKAYFKAEKS